MMELFLILKNIIDMICMYMENIGGTNDNFNEPPFISDIRKQFYQEIIKLRYEKILKYSYDKLIES